MLELIYVPSTDEDLYGKEQPPEATEQFDSIQLENEWYGIPIDDVREIILTRPITRVISTPGHVLGILNLRGSILPVIDPKLLLGLASTSPDSKNRIVVVEVDAGKTGLLVDEVNAVITMPRSHIEPLLTTFDADKAAYIRNICYWENRLMAILRVEQLAAKNKTL